MPLGVALAGVMAPPSTKAATIKIEVEATFQLISRPP
jgi:hypothetical protein